MNRQLTLRSGTLVLSILCSLAPLWAQGEGEPQETPEPEQPVASSESLDALALVAPAQSVPSRKEVAEQIAQLEGATDIEEPLRAARLDLLRKLATALESEATSLERGATFQQAITSAQVEAGRVRSELEALSGERKATEPSSSEGDADALQQRLIQVQAELTTLRARRSELDRRVTDENNRPEAARLQLVEARTKLQEVEAQLASAAIPAEDAVDQRIARWLLLARQKARIAEIQMLEQEMLSQPARVALLSARRDLAALQASRTEQEGSNLEKRVSELRQAEAEQARVEAERQQREALGKHPLIQQLTTDIAKISRDAEDIRPAIDHLRRERDAVDGKLERTKADAEEIEQTLAGNLTGSQGSLMLEQRRNLPDPEALAKMVEVREELVNGRRQELFRIERDLARLVDPRPVIGEFLTQESARNLAPEDREDLRDELERLLKSKRTHLDQLAKNLREYRTTANEVLARERELGLLVERLGKKLDEKLLWIPDAKPFGTETLEDLFQGLAWLLNPLLWIAAGEYLWADLQESYALYALAAVLVLSLFGVRPRLRARLDDIASKVDRVREDGIRLTIQALFVHLWLALTLPLPFGFLAWRLTECPDPGVGTVAIGYGLAAAICMVFTVHFLRSLFRDSGVASRHFGWTERSRKLVRRHLTWFLGIGVPTTFLVVLTQSQPSPVIRHGLGRLSFIVLMGGVTVLAAFMLHPAKGLMSSGLATTRSAWLKSTRSIWMPLGILTPVTLSVIAAMGYYYAALQLEYRLNQTVLTILVALFVHAFLLRWLTVSQRRLSLKVAMEKRAALIKSRESSDDDQGTETIVGTLEQLDVAEIKGQTQDLLRMSVGFVLLVALWFAWVGALPALRGLDDWKLWQHEVMQDGDPEAVWITLADLSLASLLLVITIAAARNLPGFLEIAVLQRLSVEPGARYAVRTLLLYAIVSTGVVVAFNAIGVDWSSVQWLAAALTVGLGFGLQEIFANFVSGLIILLERPVRVGDTVTVGTVTGVVSRIRMRATTITDWSRRELVVPNKSFITGEIVNWTLSDPIIRIKFVVGIAYGSDTELATKTLLGACTKHPMVMEHPEPNVFFSAFGESSLDFEVRVFVTEQNNTGRQRILHDLHMSIDRACRAQKIEIAFPQRDLHIRSSSVLFPGMKPEKEPS